MLHLNERLGYVTGTQASRCPGHSRCQPDSVLTSPLKRMPTLRTSLIAVPQSRTLAGPFVQIVAAWTRSRVFSLPEKYPSGLRTCQILEVGGVPKREPEEHATVGATAAPWLNRPASAGYRHRRGRRLSCSTPRYAVPSAPRTATVARRRRRSPRHCAPYVPRLLAGATAPTPL